MTLPRRCCSAPRGRATRFPPACSRLRQSLDWLLSSRLLSLLRCQPRTMGQSLLRSQRRLTGSMTAWTMMMTSKPTSRYYGKHQGRHDVALLPWHKGFFPTQLPCGDKICTCHSLLAITLCLRTACNRA